MFNSNPHRFVLLLSTVLLFCPSINAQSNPGKIVFADEAGRLLIINADGTGQTILTNGGSVLDDNPTFSPNGSKIAFQRNIGFRTDIYVMNADGTNPVAITTSDPSLDFSLNFDPSWSPDGTRLVFSSNRSGQQKSELWVVNANGTGLVRLTTNVQLGSDGQGPLFSSDRNPAWSRDGARIAFVSTRDGLTDTELYVMNADGSNPIRLTDNTTDDSFPTWSPDSQRIAFSRNGGSGNGINIISRQGGSSINVTSDGFGPSWSPDGLRLAYLQFDASAFFKLAIFTILTDGTNRIKVTNNNFDARAPSWAPTGSAPIPTFTISGQVKDANGAAVSGAFLQLFGTFNRSTQTDSSGNYSFAGLATGNYRIDISKSGFGFVPSTITFNSLSSNQTANFTAFVAFSISGTVTGVGGDILVTLTGTQNRTRFTNGGQYSFDLLPAGGNYTASITSKIFDITPGSVTFNNLSANQTANFTGVRKTYTISGTIIRLGSPKPGITVQLSDGSGFAPLTRTTDANGKYSFAGVNAGGNYTVRPVGANYRFDPQTRGFPALDENKTADFIAHSANQLLFTNAFFNVVEGNVNLQLTVARGGNAGGVGPITVDFTTADDTAKAGLDFTATSGTLSFPEGTFSQTITIPILDDQLREGTEQFSVKLSNATGEVDLGSISTALVIVKDNEHRIATQANSDRAIALNATSFVMGPFSLRTEPNFSLDTRTRIAIFVEDLQFIPGVIPIVEAVDIQQNRFRLPLEAIALFSNIPFAQLIVRLPENLSPGDLLITVKVDERISNSARITIKP